MNALQIQFLILVLAGWINRSQQNIINYLQEKNRIRREQLGGKHPRFVRSIKYARLVRIKPLRERHLRTAVVEYTKLYRFERNHQGLDNWLIDAPQDAPNMNHPIRYKKRLDGRINYYYRAAA